MTTGKGRLAIGIRRRSAFDVAVLCAAWSTRRCIHAEGTSTSKVLEIRLVRLSGRRRSRSYLHSDLRLSDDQSCLAWKRQPQEHQAFNGGRDHGTTASYGLTYLCTRSKELLESSVLMGGRRHLRERERVSSADWGWRKSTLE